jgi:hypothetical protein
MYSSQHRLSIMPANFATGAAVSSGNFLRPFRRQIEMRRLLSTNRNAAACARIGLALFSRGLWNAEMSTGKE